MDVLGTLFGYAVVLSFLAILASGIIFNKETKKQQLKQRLREILQRKINLNKQVKNIITKYDNILYRKYKQTHYLDDYGRIVENGWRKEVGYFIENVIKEEISSEGELYAEDIEYKINEYMRFMDIDKTISNGSVFNI